SRRPLDQPLLGRCGRLQSLPWQACCCASGPSWSATRPAARDRCWPRSCSDLVTPVALLGERIAVIVVAVALPEPRLVAAAQLEATHPLGALPEVQMRHHDPHRATVDRFDRLTF